MITGLRGCDEIAHNYWINKTLPDPPQMMGASGLQGMSASFPTNGPTASATWCNTMVDKRGSGIFQRVPHIIWFLGRLKSPFVQLELYIQANNALYCAVYLTLC